jgi:hypothetical protein
MSTLQGITNNQIYPQPGFSAARDENGGWRGSAEFVVTTATWAQASWRAQFAKGTPITQLDPTLDPFFSFLTVDTQTVTRNEGGLVTVMVEVTGGADQWSTEGSSPSLAEAALPTYRLEGRLQEFPLSQHPKWVELSENEQYTLGNLLNDRVVYGIPENETEKKIFWPQGNLWFQDEQIETGNGYKFLDLILAGVKTYYVPTLSWTESTQGSSPMTADQIGKLGRIDASPRGNPPTPSGTRNWMLTGASQEQRGELYQTQIEWTLSDREGWSNFLYS